MNNEQHNMQDYHYDELEIDLVQLFIVLWRAKWFIIGLVIIAVIAAAGYSLLQEHVYEVSVKFAVSRDNYITTSLDNGMKKNLDMGVLISILNSDNLALKVIRDRNLTKIWDVKNENQAVKRLKNSIDIKTNQNQNVITINYKSTNSHLAKFIVDSYIENFVSINQKVNSTDASQALSFVQTRLKKVKTDLTKAEKKLQEYQEKYQVYSIDKQVETMTDAYMKLKDNLRNLKIDYNVKQETLSRNHPELKKLSKKISETKKEIDNMEKGSFEKSNISSADIGMNNISEVTIQLERLKQEVEIQRETYRMLRTQQENLKLEAAKTNDIIELIDPPRLPDKPVDKNLKLYAVIAAVLAIMLGVFITFILEFIKNRDWEEEVLEELPLLRKLLDIINEKF